MNLKKVIFKEIAPVLSREGYYICSSAPGDYSFTNSDNSIVLSLGTTPLLSRQLIVRFFVQGTSKFNLDLEQFPGENNTFYTTQEELERLSKHILDTILNKVLPYLNIMKQVYFEPDENLYKALSLNTHERAKNFAKKHQHDFLPQKKNLRLIDNTIQSLRPSNLLLQQAVFEDNKELFLAMAAYLGEVLLAVNTTCYWGWRQVKDVSPRVLMILKDYRQFGLITSCSDTSLVLDPLRRVISAWNFAELNGYEVSRYPIP